jgi:NADH:ubiquinone reductase (H+-translocating)
MNASTESGGLGPAHPTGMKLTKPRIVIVGGGFGGLYTARALAGAPISVTLIDKRNYHLFRPMLYQAATGLLSADEISGPLRSILSRQKNIDVLLGEVSGVDTQKRVVRLEQHDIPYDFLILATGVQYNYFGHDEWSQVAPSLTSLSDADRIRAKVLLAFEQAEELAALGLAQTTSPQIQKLLTFVLVGGGTVGVEMASTLAEMSRIALAHDFRHIDPRSAQILLYESAPRLLPPYPEVLSAKAKRHLEQLGVKIYTGVRVTSIDADGIIANGQRVPAATVLWSAGVLASPAGRWINSPTDKSGKIIVNSDLSVPGHPEIFAIGDTAHVVAHSRNLLGIRSREPMLLPGVAQPAIQEGRYAALVIRSRVTGTKPPAPFWYWDKGDLAIVGRTYAVADLRFVRFWGFPAWLLWAGVHIYFLIGFANRFFVLVQWGLAFLTKRRRVRVLPE